MIPNDIIMPEHPLYLLYLLLCAFNGSLAHSGVVQPEARFGFNIFLSLFSRSAAERHEVSPELNERASSYRACQRLWNSHYANVSVNSAIK